MATELKFISSSHHRVCRLWPRNPDGTRVLPKSADEPEKPGETTPATSSSKKADPGSSSSTPSS